MSNEYFTKGEHPIGLVATLLTICSFVALERCSLPLP